MTNEREAKPNDDDCLLDKIEIEFAIPTYMTQEEQRQLYELISKMARNPVNQPKGQVHWLAGCGSKPRWSKTDAMFLGVSTDADAPEVGEPTYDDSVYHMSTFCREKHKGE